MPSAIIFESWRWTRGAGASALSLPSSMVRRAPRYRPLDGRAYRRRLRSGFMRAGRPLRAAALGFGFSLGFRPFDFFDAVARYELRVAHAAGELRTAALSLKCHAENRQDFAQALCAHYQAMLKRHSWRLATGKSSYIGRARARAMHTTRAATSPA